MTYHNTETRIPHHELNDKGEGVCTGCGKTEELRPYGENFSWICPDCGDKDPQMYNRMDHVLFGLPLQQ